MRNRCFLVLFASVLAVSACGADSGDGAEVATETDAGNDAAMNDVLGGNQASGPAALPTDAAGFVAAVGASDLYEIQSSALARQKATSPELRGFAQRLEREHGQSAAELKSAAAQAGITAEPALDAEKQAMLDELKAASGKAFDAKYLDQQRLAHQKTLMLLQNYANSGDNDALKSFADKARTMVEQHGDELNYMRS